MIWGKRGMAVFDHWVEFIVLAMVVIAILIRLFLTSVVARFTVTILCGFMFAKFVYKQKTDIFAFYVIMLGFLFGFMVGYSNVQKILLLVLFLASYKLMHWLQDEKYIK